MLESKLKKLQMIAENQKIIKQQEEKRFFDIISDIITHRDRELKIEIERNSNVMLGQRQMLTHISAIFTNSNSIAKVLKYVQKMLKPFDDLLEHRGCGILISKIRSPSQRSHDIDILIGKIIQAMLVHNLIVEYNEKGERKLRLDELFKESEKGALQDSGFFETKFCRKLIAEFESIIIATKKKSGRPKGSLSRAKEEEEIEESEDIIVDSRNGLRQSELNARSD